MTFSLRRFAAGAVFAVLLLPSPAPAQIGGMISGAINDKINQKINDAVNCLATDQACIKKAQASGKPVVVTDAKGKPLKDQSAAKAAATPDSATDTAPGTAPGAAADSPGKGVWLNYDFVPGERTIWFEDFSGDDVGDFPRRMDLVNGNFEVVKIDGKTYLHTLNGGTVKINLPETLPDRFTVEARYWAPASNNYLEFHSGDGASWWCSHDGAGVNGTQSNSAADGDPVASTAFVNCRFTVDTRYIKAYFNENRTANLPNATVTRGNIITIDVPGFGSEATLLTDIRIAAGGKKLYDALSATGRVATQGILFDVNSDRIRGESTPTLKEIGGMLQEHADLKLTIEGHTDNTGTAAGNQSLSERRAASVRQYLIDNYQVDPARLKSVGYGQTKPVGSNDTAEGRQNNRRVELVKN